MLTQEGQSLPPIKSKDLIESQGLIESQNRIDPKELTAHFEAIASFERRSDGKGEGEAREYIERELRRSGISCSVTKEAGILAFGRSGTLRARPADANSGVSASALELAVPLKAWNFSAPAPRGFQARGKVLTPAPLTVLEYLAARNKGHQSEMQKGETQKDLDGHVVLSRSFSPQLILDAESRGASAFVICWPRGGEKEIHHSGTVMWWGTPMPEESCWRPGIPVVAVNEQDGSRLIAEAENLLFSFSFEAEERVTDVFQVEASVPSTTGKPYYILVGAHLDSKCLGATDNATGAAVALSLAQAVSKCENRPFGLRVCWWSGHEFGRYTGSSIYARDHFDEMERHCVAYANIDMPGMKDAVFGTVTAGPDLFKWAEDAVRDITGQQGIFPAPARVRSWDQSFQNIGVSPFFIWTSALPEDSPHCTGNGTMPWWWHTEADTAEFCDREILNADARLYMAGILRLFRGGDTKLFDVPALWKAVITRLTELEGLLPEGLLPEEISGAPALSTLSKVSKVSKDLQEGLQRWQETECSFEESLRAVRLLNRVYYSARDAHLQDWDNGNEFVPGLSEAVRALESLRGKETGREKSEGNSRAKVIVVNYARTQWNRIGLLVRELLRQGMR